MPEREVATTEQIVQSGLEAIISYSKDNTVILENTDGYFIESFNISEILDSKQQVTFVKKVESLIRTSPEYQMYIGYLRNVKGINRCSFYGNLDVQDEVKIEFHHTPFTLYDIVDIITNHFLNSKIPVTTFKIADEVMKVHFQNLVGLVPLTTSIHKLVHKGSVKISPSMVTGNWLQFMRNYSKGISQNDIQKILGFLAVSNEDVITSAEKIKAKKENLLFRSDACKTSLLEIKALVLSANRE